MRSPRPGPPETISRAARAARRMLPAIALTALLASLSRQVVAREPAERVGSARGVPLQVEQPATHDPLRVDRLAAHDLLRVEGLDSLASATLGRALDDLRIRPEELGFDKLYADDDTFRLKLVTDILNDPLKLPGWQSRVVPEIRGAHPNPLDLISLLGGIEEATASPGDAAPSSSRSVPKAGRSGSGSGAAPPAPDSGSHAPLPDSTWPGVAASKGSTATAGAVRADSLSPAVDAFIHSCGAAERSLQQAFSRLTPEDRTRLLTLAPAFWGDSDNPDDKVRKGRLQREAGASADTTLKLTEDPVLDAAIKLDRPALTRATGEFMAALSALADRALHAAAAPPGTNAPNMPGITGDIEAIHDTPWGKLVIGGRGPNAYSEDAMRQIAFLIEPGGDDVYHGRAASAVGGLLRPFGALIDAGGDDLYDADGSSFCLGGALLGIAVLCDLSGNDVYRGDDGCLGAGFFGSGLLYDGGGADLFEGRNLCEGAGAFGMGVLVSEAPADAPPGGELQEDRAYELGFVKVPGTGSIPVRYDDNDTYICARQSQGFASTFGIGLLYDRTGNDTYRSGGRYLHAPLLPNDFQSLSQGFSIGFRPRAAGGVGILIDEQGNDFYDAEVYAQGASYWYSLGLLYDGGGNDRYLATQYAQGAGIHLSIGTLRDRGGDDHYVAKFGVTQGTAHDLSVGMLLDESGNDYYVVDGGQGISITNSVALFIDEQGNDLYATEGQGQGDLTWARGFCGAGIFLDLEGHDTYPARGPGKDAGVWSAGTMAIGIDLDRDIRLPDEIIPEPVLTKADSARAIQELFDTASIWNVGSAREKVRRARAALLAKGWPAALYAIQNKLDTQDGLVYETLRDVSKIKPDSFSARILPRLTDPDQFVQRNVISLLGEMKRKGAIAPMEAMLKDHKQEKHWPRLLQALGNIGDMRAAPAVRPFLQDPKERRRINAAVALAALKDTSAVPRLALLLDDPLLTVRAAASNALVSFGGAAVGQTAAELQSGGSQHALALRTLGQIAASIADTARAPDLMARGVARRALMAALEAAAPDVARAPERAAAVEGLIKLGDPETLEFVRLHMRDETDPFVKRTFDQASKALEAKHSR